MLGDPGCGSKVWEALDREIGQPWQNHQEDTRPSKSLAMLSHSASSGCLLTGFPARPYQYFAFALIAFFAVQVGVHPGTLGSLVLRCRFMGSCPISFGIPP